MQVAYLDNASTTPAHPQVVAAITQTLTKYGNPSSLHHLGVEAEGIISVAREKVAAMLGVAPSRLTFTSGGTEANNLAIKGLLHKGNRRGKIITSAIEHPSVLEVVRSLALEGWDVEYIPVDSRGVIDLGQLEHALNEDVRLVSIMAVNNEIGSVQPLQEISALVRKNSPQAMIHTDAVQAPGKVSLDPEKLGLDLVTVSAHKLNGPKGVGALYIGRKNLLSPILDGGGQEGGLRSGTENVIGIVGFGAAAQLVQENFQQWHCHVTSLRDRFRQGLKNIPCHVAIENGVPHILGVSFPGFRGEVLLQALSGYQVYVSTGAACAGKKGNMSHVAEAIGLGEAEITGMLRFSFAPQNTEAEIDYALDKIRQVLDELAFVRGRRSR